MEKILIGLKYSVIPKIMEELTDDSGMGTIEVVLILVVLIALVIIFKDRITALLNGVFTEIEGDAASVYS